MFRWIRLFLYDTLPVVADGIFLRISFTRQFWRCLVPLGMRRTGNELRRNSYSRAPNFRLNSTIEFRKGSPTPKLPSVMASHGFPYFFFLPVRCSVIGIYIYDKERVQFGAKFRPIRLSEPSIFLREKKKRKSRVSWSPLSELRFDA